MDLDIYAIGGDIPFPGNFVGHVTDPTTAINLYLLMRFADCRGATLHGHMFLGDEPYDDDDFTLDEVEDILLRVSEAYRAQTESLN